MIPIRTIAITILSLVWLGVATKQWAFDYPDLSSLLFALGFFLVGLYVAYDQWYKGRVENTTKNMKADIQAIDKKCNENENNIIKLFEKIK